MGLDRWHMFLWKCFVSETVVILYARRSRSTMYIVKCGCTVREKYIYNCWKFVLYGDNSCIFPFFRFSVLFHFFVCLFFFPQLSNRPHFFGFVIYMVIPHWRLGEKLLCRKPWDKWFTTFSRVLLTSQVAFSRHITVCYCLWHNST